MAGYAATLGIARNVMPSEGWQMAFSIIGTIAVGISALFRMAGVVAPEPSIGSVGNTHDRQLTVDVNME